MSVQVGQLYRKGIRRKLNGQIIDWIDETTGGYIIQKGRIVNQERYDEEMKKQADKKEAAQAIAKAKVVDVPERASAPGKVDELEKKVEGMEGDIKTILNLLKKNDSTDNK